MTKPAVGALVGLVLALVATAVLVAASDNWAIGVLAVGLVLLAPLGALLGFGVGWLLRRD